MHLFHWIKKYLKEFIRKVVMVIKTFNSIPAKPPEEDLGQERCIFNRTRILRKGQEQASDTLYGQKVQHVDMFKWIKVKGFWFNN